MEVNSPPTTTVARGRCTSEPTPVDSGLDGGTVHRLQDNALQVRDFLGETYGTDQVLPSAVNRRRTCAGCWSW